jgi:hypothetical protein
MAAHFKACPVWAAFNNKESRQYSKKLWKLYLVAHKAYVAARNPANLQAKNFAYHVYWNYARGNKWHRANVSCRCATNLIHKFARPIVRKYEHRVKNLKRLLINTTNERAIRVIRRRIWRAKVRK